MAYTGPQDFSALESQYGLPTGLLNGIYGQESGYGANVGPSSAGAMGPFQFIRGTWDQYGGGGDVWNLQDAATGAARFLAVLLQKFGGNVSQAIAAYNQGPGTPGGSKGVYGDISRATSAGDPGSWLNYAPTETQAYVPGVLAKSGIAPGQMATPTGSADAGAPVGASGSTDASGSGWSLGSVTGWLGSVAARAGVFILALLLILGGLLILAVQSGVTVQEAKA